MYKLFDIFQEIISEGRTFNTIFKKKNTWIELSPKEIKELKHNLWFLVDSAYNKEYGGHSRIKSTKDVFKDSEMGFWKASDIDEDPLADVVIFGKKTPFGVKISGIGHDGEEHSKKVVMSKISDLLHYSGFWVESSDKFAKILLTRYNVPYVKDKETIEKLFNQPIIWYGKDPDGYQGDGWYSREISGKQHKEILLGRPKI